MLLSCSSVAAAAVLWMSLVGADPVLATPPTPKIVFSEPSPFGHVFVIDVAGLRALRFDSPRGIDQSLMTLGHPEEVPMEYVRYATLSLGYVRQPSSILMIGLGGGSFSSLMHRTFNDANIDVIEINPVVVKAATELFGVKLDERYRVHLGDAGLVINQLTTAYDLILVDAYSGEGVPPHLTTDTFFKALQGRLAPNGLLVANLATDDVTTAALIAKLRKRFAKSSCATTPVDGNVLVFASTSTLASPAELAKSVAKIDADGPRLPFLLAPLATSVRACPKASRSAKPASAATASP